MTRPDFGLLMEIVLHPRYHWHKWRSNRESSPGLLRWAVFPRLPSWSLPFAGAATVALLSFVVSLKLAVISGTIIGVFTDGRGLFKPGETLQGHALAGMAMAFVSFVAIVVGAIKSRHGSNMTVISVVFAVLSLSGAVFAFSTYQQYRFLLG